MKCFGQQRADCEEACEFYESCKVCSVPIAKGYAYDSDVFDIAVTNVPIALDLEIPSDGVNLGELFLRVLELGDYNSDRCMVIFAKACGYSYSEIGLLLDGKSKQMINKHVNAIGVVNSEVKRVLSRPYTCISDMKLLRIEKLFNSNLKKLRKIK